MEKQKIKIIVTGDICVNVLLWNILPQEEKKLNWENSINLHQLSVPGAAFLLAKMIALATDQTIISPVIPKGNSFYHDHFLYSFVEIKPYPRSTNQKESKVYRLYRFMGFSGGTTNSNLNVLPLEEDVIDAPIVVIDDENNGFNQHAGYWPLAIKSTGITPVVFYKMDNPIEGNPLLQHLFRYHRDKTIIIINADDLRSKGVNISKSISWEKTAHDFTWQLKNNPNLSFLLKCKHLIVIFGLEGVIYCENDDTRQSFLYFLPYEFEGDFRNNNDGEMYGLVSAFVAGFSTAFLEYKAEGLPILIFQGIREGISAVRKYFYYGFGEQPASSSFPNPLMFEQNLIKDTDPEYVQDVKIPNVLNREYQDNWCILQEKSSASISQMAFDLVKNGEENVLMHIPTAKFGKLKTIDRIEIESYRTIHNLISEYIVSKNANRPLSIAIFGTPGSGKSYGLNQMAISKFSESITKMSYNISQFSTVLELQKAFHQISDSNLRGKIPFVIFDEFDSYFHESWGWLKYFLSPMQDGIYKDEESFHPIGKAIFVFVGGTSSSFAEFCGEKIEIEKEKQLFLNKFKESKGPDFISRLRGYINILGPNQVNEFDQFFMIRRAMLIRSLLEQKFPHLINEKGTAQIDNGVLRAMLKIPKYKHESRSVEAIMDMSMLTQAKKWEQSFLPPKEQLKLHLDENLFLRYMMHDAIFSEKIDAIAELLRNKFNALDDAMVVTGDDVSLKWEELGESPKSFYRDHVKNIPEAILLIQYDVVYIDSKADNRIFSEQELNVLIQFEYKRRKIYDKMKNINFVSSAESSNDKIKLQIFQMVTLWINCLSESNFKLEKLNIINQHDISV